MTRYAVDPVRNALIAYWSTGVGEIATTVAELPSGPNALRLATCLTELSQACWRCYTHPASAAEQQGPNSIGWHRQRERDAFSTVVPALTRHRRPLNGARSSTRVEEMAHRVARNLYALKAPPLTARITTEVISELAAIEQAELGDLRARAQQAVILSREDASPLQVAQADTILHRHPFGAEELFTRIEPTAAAIAAAHWLHAATIATADQIRLHPAQILTEVDRVKALAQDSLAEIVGAMTAGSSPWQAVMPMIRNALHVAEGHLRGVTEAKHRITRAEDLIARAHDNHPELGISMESVLLPMTPINPTRPALDLLENLLSGIRGCWVLYTQYADTFSGREADGDPARHRHTEAFLTEVRQAAAARRERLL
ncbi:hypothetical protein ETD86_39200 [Nonomuraea turkmeniaca]|uniref:Uncharacterized protein n=1 Tax=Nonomuraea turkmeniaca TaxID=103838 RepID=A0A5S4F3K2_9ACTN|nr:hypothetical protein [Nonomuraea turkmeniaca]TMR10529.1 hypothetical protein ETD86_39200 [Nonomuraea turkmeniaca]